MSSGGPAARRGSTFGLEARLVALQVPYDVYHTMHLQYCTIKCFIEAVGATPCLAEGCDSESLSHQFTEYDTHCAQQEEDPIFLPEGAHLARASCIRATKHLCDYEQQ